MKPFFSWLPVFAQETIFLNFVCQKLIVGQFPIFAFHYSRPRITKNELREMKLKKKKKCKILDNLELK